ncbi:MAG TPA: phosphate signaling complex protein PhoU [Chitinophagaceae bacterium]
MTQLQEALNQLRESVSEMARMVSRQLHKSICALLDRDENLANVVIFNEKRVNAHELIIDEACEHIFALYNPVAHDMRFVFASLKINSDLERIGDYAEGIANLVILGENKFDTQLIEKMELKKMYDISDAMLGDVITAYNEDNSKLAGTVFSRDLQLNEINRNASDLIIEYLKANTDKIAQALYLLSIIRKLERVGDHITNIAEDIIFYKEAKQLKHGDKKYD